MRSSSTEKASPLITAVETIRCLSAARFSTYLDAAGGDESAALRLYAWNIDVSAAFWPSFTLLEIALRNGIDETLSAAFDSHEWWNVARLTEREHSTVRQAEFRARRHAGRSRTRGHVIAELGFGFWVGLLSDRHHAGLWVDRLEHLFAPSVRRRSELHSSLERLHKLRNRMAHHEPIFARGLDNDHDTMIALLGYLSSESSAWSAQNSRVPLLLTDSGQFPTGNKGQASTLPAPDSSTGSIVLPD